VNGMVYAPVRMCVGCGRRAPQAALLRFSSTPDGSLKLVLHGSAPGRSGYLHPQPDCWQRFASRGGRLRSVGRSVDKPQRLALVEELKKAEHSAMVGN
jgi:predicted RNA-binding protein YlxR (DUF448 family)